MTITVEWNTGQKVSLSTTEWSLINNSSTIATSTTAGLFQPFIDLNALAAGDVFEFKIYEKCRTGDTQRAILHAEFADAQADPIWVGPALELGVGWDMTLKKISGTDRTINWRISAVL